MTSFLFPRLAFLCCLWFITMTCAWANPEKNNLSLYRWTDAPVTEAKEVTTAHHRLQSAIKNPEYMLDHWIMLPSSPKARRHVTLHLHLREAILLALRYNANIQNAELDRIVQRYQLRLAYNEFELQYALAGTAQIQNSGYSGVGNAVTHNYLATPELSLKTKHGSELSLALDNTVPAIGNYYPLLNFSFKQPLLRGFGRSANEAGLLDAIDNEWLNKQSIRQAVIDQITQVITSYRALVLSGNNLQNQQQQLKEAQKSYEINEKKIAAGQLEPTANVQQSYQIESLSLMVEQAENDFSTTAQNLLQVIGLDPDMTLAVPSDVSLEKTTIPDLENTINLGLRYNIAYQALKMGLRADERAYKAAKNQQLWQLDLNANVQAGTITGVEGVSSNIRNMRNIYNGQNVTESAGVTVTIPLNDITRRNQLIAAKVRLEKDRLNLIAAKRELITTIKNAINTLQSQAKRYKLAQKQVTLAQKSYALEKRKQQAGIASALDVSHTQNQLIQAQMGLINVKVAYLNQVSALERLLGTTLDHWQIKLRYTG